MAKKNPTKPARTMLAPDHDEDLLADDAPPAIIDTDGEVVDETAPEPDREHVDTQPEPEEPKRTRYLEHILTPAEIDDLREKRERQDVEIERLGAELVGAQERVKSLKTRVQALHDEGLEISKTIRSGVEWRNIECREERCPDWRRGESTFGQMGVATIRCDTYEPIEWRALTKEERQGNLFDAPATA